jgi:hypothetical protein
MERGLYIVGGPRRFRKPGGPEEWGTPMPLLHDSIAKIPEKDLIARVLNDVHYRDTLFNIKGMFTKGARILEQIELRHFRKELAGEIDILVVPDGHPELSTAIQVKRFKAIVGMDEQGIDDAEVGHPNRFQELIAKGIQQANETKRVGFSQVYLWVFVAVDTRARNNGWYTYDGPDSLLNSRIHQAISPVGLDPTVGLMKFEWVQPMDRPPFELSTHGGSLDRLAESTRQPSELTEWIRTMPMPVVLPTRTALPSQRFPSRLAGAPSRLL